MLLLLTASIAHGRGLLIPVEEDLPPLAMLNHRVSVTLEDQVAVTKVEQTFRNHTSRRLEATFVFPVPEGASVREFAMWVDGRRVKGELLKAEQAKKLYAEVVRKTKQPGLLEYMGSDLLRLNVYPVPPQGDQKVEVSFTAIAEKERDVVKYVYPLETDRVMPSPLEEFRLTISLKSQQPLGGVYSPTHDVVVKRQSDHEALVRYERQQAALDRDFELYYTTSGQDVGLTALKHRPISSEDGYALLLVSPCAEFSADDKPPRDIVFVLDTSGSMMHNDKIEQAKKAVRRCLDDLSPRDRFGLINFATTVNRYRDELTPASEEQIKHGKGWVAGQYASGGTAIHQALMSALEMRTRPSKLGARDNRMFTVVFFTDGQPTIGEMDTDKILADVLKQNTANTRVFALGVGDDLNAVFLDQLAEKTRALSQYVRPDENLEVKVASFFEKINFPVLTNLKLTTSGDVRLSEVYPPKLPDLFHGDQLVALARYHGAGCVAVTLDGQAANQDKQFVYELDFPSHTPERPFVEDLWARRKVGYLLDQIRINGENRELVDEVVRLAKGYGIATPYTSYLIMPDAPVELARAERGARTMDRLSRSADAPALRSAGGGFGAAGESVEQFAKRAQPKLGDLARNRNLYQERAFESLDEESSEPQSAAAPQDATSAADARGLYRRLKEARDLKSTLDKARFNFQRGQLVQNQVSKLGVDLAIRTNELKQQAQLPANALRRVAGRRCLEIGGVWIDEAFTARTPTVVIKAQSDAYFRIFDRQPQMKDVFQLGNHVVWITPSRTALVIDTTEGREQISDREIDRLFAAR